MKDELKDHQRLIHMLEAIQHIQAFTKGLSYTEYMDDFKLRLAVVKLLEIIGEATAHISQQTKDKYPEIEWTILKAMRNVFVHEYFGIDYEIIWNSLQSKLPLLQQQISHLVKVEFEVD